MNYACYVISRYTCRLVFVDGSIIGGYLRLPPWDENVTYFNPVSDLFFITSPSFSTDFSIFRFIGYRTQSAWMFTAYEYNSRYTFVQSTTCVLKSIASGRTARVVLISPILLENSATLLFHLPAASLDTYTHRSQMQLQILIFNIIYYKISNIYDIIPPINF